VSPEILKLSNAIVSDYWFAYKVWTTVFCNCVFTK